MTKTKPSKGKPSTEVKGKPKYNQLNYKGGLMSGKKIKVLTYREFFKKYYGKWTAHDILFGWFDYCGKHGIKDTYNADEEVKLLNSKLATPKKGKV